MDASERFRIATQTLRAFWDYLEGKIEAPDCVVRRAGKLGMTPEQYAQRWRDMTLTERLQSGEDNKMVWDEINLVMCSKPPSPLPPVTPPH